MSGRYFAEHFDDNQSDCTESEQSQTTQFSTESDNSLTSYYNRVINQDPTKMRIAFTKVDGTSPNFNYSDASTMESDTLKTISSTDSMYHWNRKTFHYANMVSSHIAWEWITIVVLILGYAGRYFNSSHLYLIRHEWTESENVNKSQQFSLAVTCLFLLAFSKILLAILSDRFQIARYIFIVSNMACAVCSLLFAVGSTPGWFFFLGGLIAVSTPGAWIGLIGTISRWIPHHRQGRIMSIIVSEYLLGDAITIIFLEQVLIRHVPWRIIFVILGTSSVILNIPAVFFLRRSPKSIGMEDPPPRTVNSKLVSVRPTTLRLLVVPLLKKRTFWLLCALAFEVYGVRQFFMLYSWHVLLLAYCTQDADFVSPACMESSDSQRLSILASLLFPVCGIVSSLLLGYLKDGIGRRHRCCPLFTFLCAFFVFLVCLLLFQRFVTFSLAIIFICFSGFAILGPFSLIAGAFVLELGGTYRSATASSFIDTAGFISSLIVLVFVERFGDSTITYALLAGFVLLAICTSGILWLLDLYKHGSKREFGDPETSGDENDVHDHYYIIDTPHPLNSSSLQF